MVWHPCRHRCCTHKTPAIVCLYVCIVYVCVRTLCVHHMCQYPYFRMHNYNVYRSSAIYDVTVTTFKGYRSHNSSMFCFFFFSFFFDTLADFLKKSFSVTQTGSCQHKLFWCEGCKHCHYQMVQLVLQVSSLCVSATVFIPPLCNAWFTNKGTTKKIELCRRTERRQKERKGENEGQDTLV